VRQVARTAFAEQDLSEVLEYLSDHSESAADRFTAELAGRVL
jgi:plasmid stabilization system protein ParE